MESTELPSEIDDYKFEEERLLFKNLKYIYDTTKISYDNDFVIDLPSKFKYISNNCKSMELLIYKKRMFDWKIINTYNLLQTSLDFTFINNSITFNFTNTKNFFNTSNKFKYYDKDYLILIKCETDNYTKYVIFPGCILKIDNLYPHDSLNIKNNRIFVSPKKQQHVIQSTDTPIDNSDGSKKRKWKC